jgi:hypothetical protein
MECMNSKIYQNIKNNIPVFKAALELVYIL